MKNILVSVALALMLGPVSALAGLDVSAYEELTKVVDPRVDKRGDPVDDEAEIRLYAADFPERMDVLEDKAIYRFRRKHGFGVGSHTWYNKWRNELAKLAGYAPTAVTSAGKSEPRYDETVWKLSSGPFYELIHFSDAEGTIGPKSSAKLHRDFVAFRKRAMGHPDKAFRDTYLEFEKAFGLASKNGAVVFH